MESTCKYRIPINKILGSDYSLVFAHPKYVKAIHMLKNSENSNAELYQEFDSPPTYCETTLEQTLIIVQNQGYKIKLVAT